MRDLHCGVFGFLIISITSSEDLAISLMYRGYRICGMKYQAYDTSIINYSQLQANKK
ncbi:hypothetical protein DBR06_SOUSAS5510128 [Sousa chinensis]|nr:hypothetical protein DBR06_SOUSAS5510128 [Sousa chinensis]